MKLKSVKLNIGGMTCVNCQNKIEKKLRGTAGVKSVKVSYSAGTALITYDANVITLKAITTIIKKLDYTVLTDQEKPKQNIKKVIGTLAFVVSLYILLQQFGILNLLVPGQLADSKMGYGMLFVIGLITSVHCIAMCGGINLSQCIPQYEKAESRSRFTVFLPSFMYNLGRVMSYTAVGFVLGFAGLLFGEGSDVGLPVFFQGILKILAGVFMVIMGINMLGLFPWLRKLQPRMPRIFTRKAGTVNKRNPLFVGLLNGLMPCGPLQSMQIAALASGNPLSGALSMFMFSLGTVPLMLGFGSIVSALGKKTQKVMRIGAVLVTVLGLAMLSQGGSLSGMLPPDVLLAVILALCAAGIVSVMPIEKTALKAASVVSVLLVSAIIITTWRIQVFSGDGDLNPTTSTASVMSELVDGKQVINSTLSSGRYPNITVKAGTPVKWVINAPKGSINGCNYRIIIQEYDIEHTFKTGENIIEFTPEKTGRFQYTCWMGMIRGTITVT
jgi:sulfite exporter TauE/SafE/copper chaperone CopZ/plastocyanin